MIITKRSVWMGKLYWADSPPPRAPEDPKTRRPEDPKTHTLASQGLRRKREREREREKA